MNIPNDTGHPWRLNKYVEYNHKASPVDSAVYLAYAKQKRLSVDDCIVLAWFHSMSYCELTAAYLLEQLPYKGITPSVVEDFWTSNKSNLLFTSARAYVKNMDWFIPLMSQFMRDIHRQPYNWLIQASGLGNSQQKYNNLFKYLSKWKFMGRFSVELFIEAIVYYYREGLIDLELQAPDFHWSQGSNITSGMLNIFYRDEEANEFDKTGKISPETIEFLDERIVDVQRAIKKKYPQTDTNLSLITPKMCSWRNLFKGARYGGYHHDRQLEQLRHYENVYPEYYLWKELYEIRKQVFVPELLGELGGWSGIRKERKKLWLEKGLTGVEAISKH